MSNPLSMFSTGWLSSLSSIFGKTKYQRKNLLVSASQAPSTSVHITQMDFNNLVIGKTYRITHQVWSALQNVVGHIDNWQVSYRMSGSKVLNLGHGEPATNGTTGGAYGGSASVPFVATATTLEFWFTVGGGSGAGMSVVLYGQDAFAAPGQVTFAIIEELPNHTVTTEWT